MKGVSVKKVEGAILDLYANQDDPMDAITK